MSVTGHTEQLTMEAMTYLGMLIPS